MLVFNFYSNLPVPVLYEWLDFFIMKSKSHCSHFIALKIIKHVFVGKDAVKIFKSWEKIFQKIPDEFRKKADYRRLFNTLHLIFAKTRLAGFLSPAEISDLEQKLINLSDIIFLKGPNHCVKKNISNILPIWEASWFK